MKPFNQHQGVAAPILRANIDTDTIIPSREMKRVSKQGLGEGLFASWRYLASASRTPNPDFVLNQPAYKNTSILLAGDNFGCGSSREHAVWALLEFGIRCIIAPGFGSIFFQNCIRNGILPICLEPGQIELIAAEITPDPQSQTLQVDLEAMNIVTPSGELLDFSIESSHREMLINGLDPIALTLKLEKDIHLYEQQDRTRHAWKYLD